MFFCSAVFLSLTVITAILFRYTGSGICLSMAITFGVFSYHFIMRLIVGYLYDVIMKNHANVSGWWYRCRKWERNLYDRIKVKKWKKSMPTFDERLFDPHIHSWKEIAEAMCQAELVHETIMLFSFLPIIMGKWFGAYPVFILTSVAAALIDLSFVIMQRYNRTRVMKLPGTEEGIEK